MSSLPAFSTPVVNTTTARVAAKAPKAPTARVAAPMRAAKAGFAMGARPVASKARSTPATFAQRLNVQAVR